MRPIRSRQGIPVLGALLLCVCGPFAPGTAQTQVFELDHTRTYGILHEALCVRYWDSIQEPPLERVPSHSDQILASLCAELERLQVYSALEDENEESDLIESGFMRLCGEDPARCLGWIETLGRSGSLDGDVDGVLDGADACPGTPTKLGRAQSILLSQQVALMELGDILEDLARVIDRGFRGTLGERGYFAMGESLIPIYYELVSLGNKQEGGRYIFGGARSSQPPFKVSGSFDDIDGPTVTYHGSGQTLELAIGLSGERVPIAYPGSRTFLSDLDLDGAFPDAPGADLFELVKASRRALQEFDPKHYWHDFGQLEEVSAAHGEAFRSQFDASLRETRETFAATKRIYPRRERSSVDASGCSQEQFCSAVSIEQKRDVRECLASDFMNDEPLSPSPGDCRVVRREKSAECVAGNHERKKDR